VPDVRIGLIGLGKAGLRHAAAGLKAPGVILVAADPAPAAREAAARLEIPCYSDWVRMVDDAHLDAVIVSLPHGMLSAVAVACARRGLHVLIEKPMGVTLAEADAVIEAACASGVRLMVNFVHRFRAEYRQARAAIEAGAIGRVAVVLESMAAGRGELPAWVWDRKLAGGGMLMYNAVHCLDRLAWLAGSPIARIAGAVATHSHPVELEDDAVASMVFQNGALGALVQHKSDAPVTIGRWQTMVWGTRGAIAVLSGGGLEIASDKERARLEVQEDDRFLGALTELLAAIAEGRDPSPGGADGRRALAAVLAIYEAARTGQTRELEV
jgi:UDP-N-acetyl-2-amino-2-deoxyglucuronate dehydrogenase